MRVKYPDQSEYVIPIENFIYNNRRALLNKEPITIELKAGGYDDQILVRVREEDELGFFSSKDFRYGTRFPQRIKAAAWALHRQRCYGRFLITHKESKLTIKFHGE
jgi:hypothetical protein